MGVLLWYNTETLESALLLDKHVSTTLYLNILASFMLMVVSSTQSHVINLNAFGDDYVSFVAMHISFSPDGKYILVSTGELVKGVMVHRE